MVDTITFGKYIPICKLGTGASGTVWKCNDNNGNVYAVKFINRECDVMGEKIAWRCLPKHTNLLNIIEISNSHIVYELCDGDLSQVLPLNINSIRVLAKDILTGLDQLHRRKIIHGDIKPENILIKDGIAKLADYGSADFEYNMCDCVVGTRNYRAPESLLGMVQTSAIDLWSLGCVLYEMATAQLLFDPRHMSKWRMASIEVHLSKMVNLFGPLPPYMLNAKYASKYFSKKSHGCHTRHGAVRLIKLEQLEPNLADLITKLLTLDPSLRPSAQECLNHPFVKKLN